MSDGLFTALGTAAGTYFGMPALGASIGAAIDGAGNRRAADEQRSDRYQVAVRDMMAAGLNPMLAYSQGGAPPTSSMSGGDPGAQVTATNGQELQRQLQQPQIENIKAQTLNTQANTAESVSRTEVNNAQAQLIREQTLGLYDPNAAGGEGDGPLNIRQAQAYADLAARRVGTHKDVRETVLTDEQIKSAAQDRAQRLARFSDELRLLKEQVLGAQWSNSAQGLDLNRRKSESDFWGSPTGKMRPYVDSVLPMVNSAVGVARLGR